MIFFCDNETLYQIIAICADEVNLCMVCEVFDKILKLFNKLLVCNCNLDTWFTCTMVLFRFNNVELLDILWFIGHSICWVACLADNVCVCVCSQTRATTHVRGATTVRLMRVS